MTPKTDLSKLRWAAYVRQSRTSERDMSLTEQHDTIERDFTRRHGIEIPADRWFEDQDVSGGKMRRKHFDELMKLAEAGEIDGVVVARVSRFARTLVGALGAIEVLDKQGVMFVSATEPLDTSTATGKLLLSNYLAIAEWELAKIREQWNYFQGSAIARGIHIGHGACYGYRRGEDRKLYVVEEEARIVREIFSRRAQREPWSDIAAWLNAEAPRGGGKRWTPSSLKSMVGSRVYTGAAFSGAHVNAEAHQGIVTLAQFDAAQDLKTGRAANGGGELPLLAGLIRCAGCRFGMTKIRDAKTGKIRAYKCSGKHTSGDCSAPAYVGSDAIEQLVQEVFGNWHFHSERAPISADERAVREAEAQVEDLTRRLELVEQDDARLEALGPERFNSDLLRRRLAIDAATEALAQARAALERDSHRPVMLAEEWESLDIEQRRAILRRAIDAVYVRRADGAEAPEVSFGVENPELFVRTLVRWAGEDTFEKPERGKPNSYSPTPIPWPERDGQDPFVTMWQANTPAWIEEPDAVGGLVVPAGIRGTVERVAS